LFQIVSCRTQHGRQVTRRREQAAIAQAAEKAPDKAIDVTVINAELLLPDATADGAAAILGGKEAVVLSFGEAVSFEDPAVAAVGAGAGLPA